MALSWQCLDSLTAIGGGIGAWALGALDGGIAVGALVGGSQLARQFAEARARHGLDDAKAFRRHREAIIERWEERAKGDWAAEADLETADRLLATSLLDAMPDRQALGRTVVDRRFYPERATELIIGRLAEWYPIFRAEGEEGASPTARAFAQEVIRASLDAALDDPDYARLLMPHMLVAIGQGVADVQAAVDQGNALAAETNRMVQALYAAMQGGAAQAGVTDAALLALAGRVAENVSDPRQALVELERAVEELVRLRDAAARGTNLGQLVDEVLRGMAAANEQGRIDDAADAGERAFAEWRERQELERQKGIALSAAMIEQHRLRFDTAAMAHWVEQRVRLEQEGAPVYQPLRDEQHLWYSRGSQGASLLDIEVSILLASRTVDLAQGGIELGLALNDLAIALFEKGRRVGGADGHTALEAAAQACLQGRDAFGRDTVPRGWAMVQNTLGPVLFTQGKALAGAAGDALIERAIDAMLAALEIRTREENAVDWASSHTNLGNAYVALAERRLDGAPVDLLDKAVVAFETALLVFTPDENAEFWASAQNNLGNALLVHAQVADEGQAKLLDRAAASFAAALTVRTPDRMPAQWAMTQSNMANALQQHGLLVAGAEGASLLQRSIDAYAAATTVLTRENAPRAWAMIRSNASVALARMSERSSGVSALEAAQAARTAALDALSIYTREHMPHDHATTMEHLAKIGARIAELQR